MIPKEFFTNFKFKNLLLHIHFLSQTTKKVIILLLKIFKE